MLATACASTGAVPKPFPMPGPAGPAGLPGSVAPATNPAPRSSFDGYALAGTALSLRGAPYRNGGTDPTGFDCSGFTQYVFAQYGVSLPRDVRDQYRQGKLVKPEDLEAGDLVFFTTTDSGASHVAIAIGGDEFVHAPSSAGVVRVEHLSSRYWAPRYLGAKRVN
jgi:cell wall-associated NlpC family hydrolase